MDCLITLERASGRSVVHVVGRLTEHQVPDLLEACADAAVSPVSVDLTDLVSLDAVGLQALRRVRAEGTSLTNVPRYMESMLAD